MPWFLPLALGVGVISTRQVWIYCQDPAKVAHRRGAWLLLFLGWFPLVAWILNNLLPQY